MAQLPTSRGQAPIRRIRRPPPGGGNNRRNIAIPPLRERTEDLPPLARHFVERGRIFSKARKMPPGFSIRRQASTASRRSFRLR
jgi:hypothetical protein